MGILRAAALVALLSGTASAAAITYADYADVAPSTASQTENNLPLVYFGVWSEGGIDGFNGLLVDYYGDAAPGQITFKLWRDFDDNGIFNSAVDQFLSSQTVSNASFQAALGFANETLGGTTKYFFINAAYSNVPGGLSVGAFVWDEFSINGPAVVAPNNFPLASSLTEIQVALYAKPAQGGYGTPTTSPNHGGFDTGLFVNSGQKFIVHASGSWDDGAGPTTAAGHLPNTGGLVSGVNLGALIGRVGGGSWSLVTSGSTGTASGSGPLFLAMNDSSYTDNSGALAVTYAYVPAATHRVWIGGTSGLENKASVNSNWQGGLRPFSREKAFFGTGAVADCHWDIPNMELAELHVSTSFNRTLKLVQTGGYNRLIVSSHVTLGNGVFSLGEGNDLELKGRLTVLSSATLEMGNYGGLFTSGVTVYGTLRSTSTGGGFMGADALGDANWDLWLATHSKINVGGGGELRLYHVEHVDISSGAIITKLDGLYVDQWSGSDPVVRLQADQVMSRLFNGWSFDIVSPVNVAAQNVVAGSTIVFREAKGPYFGSLFEQDPNQVVRWEPDGGGNGQISGNLTLPLGPSASDYRVLITTDPFGRGALLDQTSTLTGTPPLAYTFASLPAPNTFYVFGWKGGLPLPSGTDPRGGYNNSNRYKSAPTFVPDAGSLSARNVNIDSWFIASGSVTFATAQVGLVRVQSWNGIGPCTTCTLNSQGIASSTGAWAVPVPKDPNLDFIGFVDVNQNGFLDSFEARGSSVGVDVTLANHPDIGLTLQGGALQPGGTVYLTAIQTHNGQVRTFGDSDVFKIQAYATGPQAQLSSIKVEYTGQFPPFGFGPRLSIWESKNQTEPDVFKGDAWFDGGMNVTTATIAFQLPDIIGSSTRTYFVRLDHQFYPAPFSGLRISSTANFGLAAGQMAQQAIYPLATPSLPLRMAVHADFFVGTDNSGGNFTGIQVFTGQTLSLTAFGNWKTSQSTGPVTAAGEGPTGLNTVLPQARAGELIGRIQGGSATDSSAWFRVGASTTMAVPKTGLLYLGMNDTPGAYYDNSGEVFVSHAISGSTTGAIGGTLDYQGEQSGTVLIEARRCNFSTSGGCGSYTVERTVPVGVAAAAAPYPYILPQLPPGSYEVVGALNGFSNKSGRTVSTFELILGSTVTADFTIFPGTSSIMGTITYNGVMPFGDFKLAVTTSTHFEKGVSFLGGGATSAAGGYTIPGLLAPASYFLVAFRDGNFNDQPDGPEPFGYYGAPGGSISDFAAFLSTISVSSTSAASPINVTLNDMSSIAGEASFGSGVGGLLVVEALNNGKVESRHFSGVFPHPFPHSQPYSVPLIRPSTNYSVFAYLDANVNGQLGAGEPFVNAGPGLIARAGSELRLNLPLLNAPAPNPPASFSALGKPGGVEFQWARVSGANQYRLLSSTGGALIVLQNPTTSYLDPLSPDASSQIRAVDAVNFNGTSSSRAVQAAFSLAAAPVSLATTTVGADFAFINWGSLNPPSTVFEVHRATDANGLFVPVMTVAAAGVVDQSLAPQSTYYWRVRALNGNMIPSAFSNTVSTITPASTVPSIAGTVNYPGKQPGLLKVHFSTMATMQPVVSISTLPAAVSTQTYYSGTLTAAAYFVRGFIDVDGDNVTDSFEDKSAVQGPVVVGASPVAGVDFAVAVDTVAPAPPSGLKLTPGFKQVRVGWSPPTKNADGSPLLDLRAFVIQRTTSASPMADYATVGLAATTYLDAFPALGTQNFYRVLAQDLGGQRSAPTSSLGAAPSLGGSISGFLVNFAPAGPGAVRVRLSTIGAPGAPFIAESSLSSFTFSGLGDGAYFLRAFIDENNNGLQDSMTEPSGTHGGLNNPYPIVVAGGNAVANANATVCDRTQIQVSSPAAGTLVGGDCPAQDKGPGHSTDLYAFTVGGGQPGSLGVGSRVSLTLSSSFDNELILLGPDGRVLARDNRAGGVSSVEVTLSQPGVYLVEPTSFQPGVTGGYSLVMHITGSFAGQVAGNIAYSGSQTGVVNIQLFGNPDPQSSPIRISTQAGLGAYSVTGLHDGLYYIRAFRDFNGNSTRDPGEAQGVFGVSDSSPTTVMIQGGVASPPPPANITLVDPVVGAVKGAILYEGTKPGLIRVEAGKKDPSCPSCQSLDEVLSFASTTTGNNYFLGFLPPATDYVVAAYVDANGNKDMDPLESKVVVGSITVVANSTTTLGLVILDNGGGPSGGATLRGAINYAGALQGPVWMGLARDPSFGYIDYVTVLPSTGPFIRSGLKGNATYYMVAFMDVNNNGEPEERSGEPIGIGAFEGYAGPPPSFENMVPIQLPLSGSVTAFLTLEDAPTGRVNGRVTYEGTLGPPARLIVEGQTQGNCNSEFCSQKVSIPLQSGVIDYPYMLQYLAVTSSLTVRAFVDANGSNRQDFGEPYGQFGFSNCSGTGPCFGSPVAVSSGPGTFPTYGVNFNVFDSGTGGGQFSNKGTIVAELFYLGTLGGPVYFRIFPNADLSGSPLYVIRVPESGSPAPGPGDFKLVKPGLDFGTYSVDAFRDPSGSGVFNPLAHPYQAFGQVDLSQSQTRGRVDGPAMTDPSGGGSLNAFTGSFAAASGARFDGGATDIATNIVIDSVTAGGPYAYVSGITSQNEGAEILIVRYSSTGVMLSSATVNDDGAGNVPRMAFAADLGKLFSGAAAVPVNNVRKGSLQRYTKELALEQTVFFSSSDVVSDIAYYDGSIYIQIGENEQNTGTHLKKLTASTLVQTATGTFQFPASTNNTRTLGMALDQGTGEVYAAVASSHDEFGAVKILLKYGPNLDASGAPIQADITGLPFARDLTMEAGGGNVWLGLLSHDGQTARLKRYTSSLQPAAEAPPLTVKASLGTGLGNLKLDTSGYIYVAWQGTSNGGDCFVGRYDASTLALANTRTYDGLDNTRSDACFSLSVLDSTNVFVAASVDNSRNLDWATLRLNLSNSGAVSAPGQSVTVTTATAVRAIWGNLLYSGAQVSSGTARAFLIPAGATSALRVSTAAFGASRQYLFNALSDGVYHIRAFIDLNGNLLAEAGEPIVYSTASGVNFTGTTLPNVNLQFCDRLQLSTSAVTASLTAADCRAWDKGGAFQKMYTFSGRRGQAVTITMTGVSLYDTYLTLYDDLGALLTTDDESAGGGNARITNFTLPRDGLYTVGASAFAPGITGSYKLEFGGSAGTLGSIAGDVEYTGSQGGQTVVGLFSSPSFSTNSFVGSKVLAATRTFTFADLATGVTYYLGAFIDVNFNLNPDAGEDAAVFGTQGVASPIFLESGQALTGVKVLIESSTAALASQAFVNGEIFYAGARVGPVRLEFWSNSAFSGRPVAGRDLAQGPGFYDVGVPGNISYFVRAFLDVNNDFLPGPDEPKGVYSPSNQGAESVFAPAGGAVSGVNLTLRDPGSVNGTIAGEGAATILPTALAAGDGVYNATITFVTGSSGILLNGRVGFTMPPGFPMPQSVVANSTVAVSAVQFSGPSAFVTVTGAGGFGPGHVLAFVLTGAFSPCQVGPSTVTVSSVRSNLAPPQPLFGGSPVVLVAPGAPRFFQPANPYFSLRAGELSEPQRLELKDGCGNKTAAAAPETAEMRAKKFDFNTYGFVTDPDLGLSTSAVVSTTAVISLPFAVGQSSHPFYVVSASTGFKSLELFFDLSFPTTFYNGLTVLSANALTQVRVATAPAGVAGASVTIGALQQAYVMFQLEDPNNGWHVLVSSVPFKPDVEPVPVWERWGFGQPASGEIAWDGRFSPWINGGARVPNGLYYVRVQIGGSGVRDDRLRVLVNVPQVAGRVFDAGVIPNPPLTAVRLQAYGPNGFQTAATDANGRYVLAGLGAGVNKLLVSRDDYLEGSFNLTVTAGGLVSTFTALSGAVSGALNGSGGIDVFMNRAPSLRVVPSLDVTVSTQASDAWGGLQVRSSTSAAVPLQLFSPLRLPAGTTTFDDGGQWDPATQQFVTRTQFKFNVAAGTYNVSGFFPGLSIATGTVFVPTSGATLVLPAFTRKGVVSGLVTLPSNPQGTFVSVNAVPLSTAAAATGGFGGVFINAGQLIGTYTVAGLDAGSYILRANAQGFVSLSSGPIAVTLGSEVTGVNFPVFGTGATISGIATINFDTAGKNPELFVSAWSPGSLNFGSTHVVVAGGVSGLTIPYSISGLTPGATYQLFADLFNTGGRPQSQELLPLVQPAPGSKNFTFVQSSGVILGTILLPAGNTDFLNVFLSGKVIDAARPEEVGHEFVEVSTSLPNFFCQPSNVVPVGGYCGVGNSTGTFSVFDEATETLDLTFFYRTTGQSVKRRISVVSGSTSTIFVDLAGSTFTVSGSINNQITNSLFNTNVKLAANAPYIAPPGWPAALSSSTARVLAIRQDITDFRLAVSETFDESTTRVGYIAGNGTFTITNVPSGVYMLRTENLRSCATCAVAVPAVSRLLRVSGADVADVSLTLSDGYSVSGSISLDGGLLDSRALTLTLRNRRQEVVRSTTVYLGDPSLGLTANSVSYSFDSLPADDFYTLTVFDSKYAGRPLKFPEPGLSPNGLASHLTSQNVTLQRAAFLIGRLKDGKTGELIGASNADLLAPNFRITATANPWIEGGFAQAASSVAGRPIEADGFFRVGPLIPSVAYDMRLAQTSWDSAFLSQGSQNYAPALLSGLTPGPGEVKDVGVVGLHQGQSLTGVIRQSTTTGAALGGIKVVAKPSFGDASVSVQTYSNSQGRYTLWVSTYISNQFDVTAAPREGNLASNGLRYGEVTIRSVSLLASTTADFFLEPLLASVTGQVVVAEGELSYPFGDQRGFPAAAINLQPAGVVPTRNPLGDIEAITDARGLFTVPGLSTGAYTLRATSLGYSVYTTTISVSTSGASAGIITLQRGATVTGRILKSDGSSPASSEVGGVAAANFGAGEFVIGSVEIDPVAKTASAYSISGFKPGVVYDLVILPADETDDVSFPPEGDNITFSAAESTSTKNINLTFAPSGIDCAATVRALGNSQFQLKIDCTKPLRNTAANDNDLDVLLTPASGAGQLLGSDKSLSGDRRRITAIYRAAALETTFAVRLLAAAATVDPKTGDNFVIDKTFTLFTGVDANVVSRVANINGGSVSMQPSGEDELLGLDERSRLDLRAGTFALESDPTVAATTISVSVGMRKGRDQTTITGLYLNKLGYAPASVGGLTPAAFPSEMAAAMTAYRVAASTKVGGANPLSSFYDIFLPAGIRHQLQQLADLTLSYDLSQSTAASINDVNVWFFNASTGRFQLENTNRRVDPVNKTITVSVDHFSTFVVLDSTPVVSRANPNSAGDISVANFPNPADCITHSNLQINSIFAVGGIHPPFKGTMIRMTLPGSANQIEEAKINIYNLAGELVKTINVGPVPGQFTHYVPWDCSNGSGETVSSGVYLGEVRWAGRSKFVKIAIIKGSGL